MQRFQRDLSAIVLDEIALEGLDGITVEALCTRLSICNDWPIKPINESVKTIIWSIVVCLKNIEFYRLNEPREPLVIYNRYEYIHGQFGSIYEPKDTPKDIYPNHCIEDGLIMGSCKDYFTRFNLGTFPRKITVEEVEKRWNNCLVIVASQEVRTKALIPEEKQFSLKLPVRSYLVLEKIGRARYLGEASHGTHSLRSIFPDPKALSYIRNRLTLDGLIKNQIVAYAGTKTQMGNRVVISSLIRFFVKQQSVIEVMVEKIVEFLKKQPNQIATYDQVKSTCSVSLAKTFKQPQLKKFCNTNLKLNYRDLYPNATKTEYINKKDPKVERTLRCIQLKQEYETKNQDLQIEKKLDIKGHEFKRDAAFDRQILRWIENQGDNGATLSDISRVFRFTSDGNLDNILKLLIKSNYLSKHYCDRGRAKVHVYVAKIKCSTSVKNENIFLEKSVIALVTEESLMDSQNLLQDTTLNDTTSITPNDDTKNTTLVNSNINQCINSNEIDKNDYSITNLDNSFENITTTEVNSSNVSTKISLPNKVILNDDGLSNDLEQQITRTMDVGYCQQLYENSKQTIFMTDRFFFRQQIIFSVLNTDSVISLVNLKKTIINTEKENPKFIGTLDIKTLVKILGYFESKGRLKSVLYKVSYGNKTINQTFIGVPDIDFSQPDIISYMNSFLNKFNNKMKTKKANKKWNLMVYKSPEPKIDIFDLKLPRFMKMRSLHEYLFYIVYEHPGTSLTNACEETEKTVLSYKNDLIQSDKVQIPIVYNPTIGWKMFVPPLPKYPKYPEGWFFVSDIIHHMPLDLMLKIVNFNKTKVNLEKLVNYATHPVFKYLPLMTLSSEVRNILSQGLKKHIQNTLSVLRLLCTIGLLQFGPKTYKDTELIYAYLNRRASLLNTVQSEPSYYRVSDITYERRLYEFTSSYEIENYWLDTWYFCTNTPLGYRTTNSSNKPGRQDMLERTKMVIEECCASRSEFEAIAQDDGSIPGDNKGAAGFDSHLYSHLSRNWNIKKKLNQLTSKKKTKNLLLSQRILKNRKKKETKKTEDTSNKLYQIRYKWTPNEDNILIFWKVGTFLIKQVQSHAFISYGIKDVMKSVFGKFYRLKSVDNYLRRIRYLMKNPLIESRVQHLYESLKTDEEVKDMFKNDIQKQKELYMSKKFRAMRELIVMNIKKLVIFLRERGISIETRTLLLQKKRQITEKPIDEKPENFLIDSDIHSIHESITSLRDISQEYDYSFSLHDINLSVINSLIHSSLSNQSSDPKISLGYLLVFKQYSEEILKQAFDIIKDDNLITCSQYHKKSLQVLLSTSHVIQSKTYEYASKFYSIIVGKTDTGRFKEAFLTYEWIKNDLFERKILLLSPSCGFCTLLTSLCACDFVDICIEFDKKFLEYMSDETSDNGSNCLKNTLKRMRSRHFDLLTDSNDTIEYIKIITSITKQLKNYQVVCRLKNNIPNIENDMNPVFEEILSYPIFNPKLECLSKLNELCQNLLEFCKSKEHCGATHKDIKEYFNSISLFLLKISLNDLMDYNFILRAGIELPTYVHYSYADVWLIKLPNTSVWNINEEIEKEEFVNDRIKDINGPPLKKMKEEISKSKESEEFSLIKVRPWTRLDLTINQKVLEKFLNSVLSKIVKKPGIFLKNLKKEYNPIIQPLHVRELVEMLEAMKCVKMISIKNVLKPSCFSELWPSNHNLSFCDALGLEDESSIMIEPTLDCDLRFGYCSSRFTFDIE
ncbi:general transcription factor 3C polypeptide 1 isoform X2 [Daktulosphaira vitifoliae]|uniref:general transcription factor 3C polypeptide 1 isoform X2 n=1 Tax=Daktulosphaira vitifoliae TaxID=58002 RepID=UPI0021AA0D56|nr:general transcription factor 3C polypeptide 1 isoform X2 [Daktulosphaira vitifoliae]